MERILAATRRLRHRCHRPLETLVVTPVSTAVAHDLELWKDLFIRTAGARRFEISLDRFPPAGISSEVARDVLVHATFAEPLPESDLATAESTRRREQIATIERLLRRERGRLMRPRFHQEASPETIERARHRLRTRLSLRNALEPRPADD